MNKKFKKNLLHLGLFIFVLVLTYLVCKYFKKSVENFTMESSYIEDVFDNSDFDWNKDPEIYCPLFCDIEDRNLNGLRDGGCGDACANCHLDEETKDGEWCYPLDYDKLIKKRFVCAENIKNGNKKCMRRKECKENDNMDCSGERFMSLEDCDNECGVSNEKKRFVCAENIKNGNKKCMKRKECKEDDNMDCSGERFISLEDCDNECGIPKGKKHYVCAENINNGNRKCMKHNKCKENENMDCSGDKFISLEDCDNECGIPKGKKHYVCAENINNGNRKCMKHNKCKENENMDCSGERFRSLEDCDNECGIPKGKKHYVCAENINNGNRKCMKHNKCKENENMDCSGERFMSLEDCDNECGVSNEKKRIVCATEKKSGLHECINHNLCKKDDTLRCNGNRYKTIDQCNLDCANDYNNFEVVKFDKENLYIKAGKSDWKCDIISAGNATF